jgi:hypothetical protein
MTAVPASGGVADVGTVVDRLDVTIGPQFLDLFSSHLYSSPNKAFEELVSNSWDAGASKVFIHVPDDRRAPGATISILDDGVSMDLSGLRDLWAVATSNKRKRPQSKRPQIGKFGIGKLATYLLAHELTYVCRAADGILRAVTMDYRFIDSAASPTLHIDPINLKVRELTQDQFVALLSGVPNGQELLSLLSNGLPVPGQLAEWEDEYGGNQPPPPAPSDTWTLALLTSLKPASHSMQLGRLRWLFRTALPLSSSIRIVFNNEVLTPSKIGVGLLAEWTLGKDHP